MPNRNFSHSRRTAVRAISFGIFMTAVLFFSIVMQMMSTRAQTAQQKRICGEMLAHMSEEHAGLSAALAENDPAEIRRYAGALYGDAAMIASVAHESGDPLLTDAISDTAQFYSALIRAADGGALADPDFWQTACDTVCTHTASLALAIASAGQHPSAADGERIIAEHLSAFTKAFRTDPLRLPSGAQPVYTFDREVPVTQAEARQKLRTLIGNAASFLGSTVTDDAHGCYVFSCRNGYAEMSLCGGHLLSYAFYPRSAEDAASHVLCDTDLSSLAASFLQKAGIPYKNTDQWHDRHGIRVFSVGTNNGKTVTVGVRMHDGAIVRFDAQAYYRRDD